MPDMQTLYNELVPALLNLLKPIGLLAIGWIVVALISSACRRLLGKTNLDNWIAAKLVGQERASNLNVEKAIAKAVYIVGMIFVVIAVLESLELRAVSQPLNRFLEGFFAFLPRLVAAGALALAAWAVATLVRALGRRTLETFASGGAEGEEADVQSARATLTKTIPDTLYWAIYLVFLPGILHALALDGVLAPVQNMVDRVLSALPNIAAAALIIAAGFFAARIVRRIVTSLLQSAGLDRLLTQGDVRLERSPSELVALVAYALILIPVVIAGLNQLGLDAVTQPASEMLSTLLSAIPQLLGAAIILTIAYFAAKFAAGLVTGILAGVGFDSLPERLGLPEPAADATSPSQGAGRLLMLVLMLFATVEALNQLGFAAVAGIVTRIIDFGGQVLLGTLILAAGLYLGKMVSTIIARSQLPEAQTLSTVARVAILVLASAMSLSEMGLGDEIIRLTFGLTLGALAVACALSFGLGGREAAAGLLRRWLDKSER